MRSLRLIPPALRSEGLAAAIQAAEVAATSVSPGARTGSGGAVAAAVSRGGGVQAMATPGAWRSGLEFD